MHGAILTLADGSNILLDTASKQVHTMQGQTKLVHTPGEGLAYEASQESGEVLYNTLTTPRGRQFQLTLADGSRVWLNAGSSIRFPTDFRNDSRVVEVTGEVYFEVATYFMKDRKRRLPFTVKTDALEVQVTGTKFNVQAYSSNEDISISLLEGSVIVNQLQHRMQLSPGQQAKLSPGSTQLKKNNADMEMVMAWKNGYFMFDETDITTMMHQAARWYNIDVEFPKGIPADKFGGTISRDVPLAEFLKILDYSDIKVTTSGRKVIITP